MSRKMSRNNGGYIKMDELIILISSFIFYVSLQGAIFKYLFAGDEE